MGYGRRGAATAQAAGDRKRRAPIIGGTSCNSRLQNAWIRAGAPA
ncbi:Uncharacterised protein [Bordetella pertussis]|nr:Uncharacterised protein [Bordetella pertussis]